MPLPIYVTKTFLPPLEEYLERLKPVFENACLTNQGPQAVELEETLRAYLGVPHFKAAANGTLALQLGLKALGVSGGEVITTPFSYVATAGSIIWENCVPVFVDIEPGHFTIDPGLLDRAVTPRTRAVMPVHVFGCACQVDDIADFARRRGLKVIYDGAHAFGAKFRGRSLLDYGDLSTCSFHATKLFHTAEGGACIARDPEVDRRLDLLRRFGHEGDRHFEAGTNAKMSELHAAMGLAVFPYLPRIMAARRQISESYDRLLEGLVTRPSPQDGLESNYGYYPVLFRDEAQLQRVFYALARENIFPRRYFYPALNLISYLDRGRACPAAEDVASRVACLPLSPHLTEDDVQRLVRVVRENV